MDSALGFLLMLLGCIVGWSLRGAIVRVAEDNRRQADVLDKIAKAQDAAIDEIAAREGGKGVTRRELELGHSFLGLELCDKDVLDRFERHRAGRDLALIHAGSLRRRAEAWSLRPLRFAVGNAVAFVKGWTRGGKAAGQ